MKLGKFEFKKPRYPRFWLGLIATVVLVPLLWGVYTTIFVQSTNPPARPPAQPSLKPQPLTPSSYTRTRRLFGPWQLTAVGSTGAPHLVMLLDNGGVDISSKVVRVDKTWQEASASEIVSVEPGKHTVKVGFGYNEVSVATLKYGQAFILAQRPDAVYSYLADGPGRAKLVGTTVSALSKH
jgi:hypothetical protein